MSQVEYYDQMYADEKFDHDKLVHGDRIYEDLVAGLHRGPLALR